MKVLIPPLLTSPLLKGTRGVSLITKIEKLLGDYARFGIDLSLDRVVIVLEKLDNPHHKIPIIHVAGTNGKGSVCAFVSSILQTAGYRTGRYTSPHLISWRERICIDGNFIREEHLLEALQTVISVVPDRCLLTQFELITCAMWWCFAQEQVDIAVIETGLGGRLDATNVCNHPLVTVITTISRDHWQRLGDSLAEIAGEKAGILKFRCPLVLGNLPPIPRGVILQRAEALECPVIEVLEGVSYDLPLLGGHQKLNCALGIEAVKQLKGWHITKDHIDRGVALTKWQGRLEWISYKNAQILLDGAHNLAGAVALRQYIDEIFPRQATAWIIGILATKDYNAMINTLPRSGDWLFPVAVAGHQSISPDELVQLVNIPIEAVICPTLKASLHRAIETGLPIVVCGSLYLIGELKREIDRDFGDSL